MYDIHLTFEQKEAAPVVLQQVSANQTILEVLLQKEIELHHNCGGVCACTTCHIYIEEGMEHLAETTDQEEDYIDRAIRPRLNSRLACQSLLKKGSGTIKVTVPDQTQFLGE